MTVDGIDQDSIPSQYADLPQSDEEMDPCSSPMGHSLDPINDEAHGPYTRMVCIYCNENRLVVPDDLLPSRSDRYPEWCEVDTDTDGGQADE